MQADDPEPRHAKGDAALDRSGSGQGHMANAEEEQVSVRQLRQEHLQLQKELQDATTKEAELTAELAEMVRAALSCRPAIS